MAFRNQEVIVPDGWRWNKFEGCDEFWIGEDVRGNKWLLKNRGPFYALREMAFSLIAERLGINVQLSRYLILSKDTKKLNAKSRYQLAIEYIEECKNERELKFDSYIKAYETGNDVLASLAICGHQDALDRVKVDMLSYIFGANETSEILLSDNGRIYIIDNEQMFSTSPVDLLTCDWFLENKDMAMNIAIDLCIALAEFKDKDIELFTSVPEDFKVEENWPVRPLVLGARDYAKRFVEIHA